MSLDPATVVQLSELELDTGVEVATGDVIGLRGGVDAGAAEVLACPAAEKKATPRGMSLYPAMVVQLSELELDTGVEVATGDVIGLRGGVDTGATEVGSLRQQRWFAIEEVTNTEGGVDALTENVRG